MTKCMSYNYTNVSKISLSFISSLPVFIGLLFAQSSVFCLVVYLFVFIRLAMVLSVLPFTACNFPFDVFTFFSLVENPVVTAK